MGLLTEQELEKEVIRCINTFKKMPKEDRDGHLNYPKTSRLFMYIRATEIIPLNLLDLAEISPYVAYKLLHYNFIPEQYKKNNLNFLENSVSNGPWSSIRYAIFIKKGRFPEGEETIMGNIKVRDIYINFLKEL